MRMDIIRNVITQIDFKYGFVSEVDHKERTDVMLKNDYVFVGVSKSFILKIILYPEIIFLQ